MSNLREIREAAGVSQTALAEMVGCSQGAIGHYEACRRTPSLDMCRVLVDALNKLGASKPNKRGEKVQVDDLFPPKNK